MDYSDMDEKRLAFDLRITYAEIVGKKLRDIQDARDQADYHTWFRELNMTYPLIFARVDIDREDYSKTWADLRKKVIAAFHKYPRVHQGRSRDPEGVKEIEEALTTYDHFIFRLLHNTKQFGETNHIPGLE